MKCKYENKNGTCGLKGSYAYRHKCFTEDLCKCFEPLSNADRIRGMNDEELAGLLREVVNLDGPDYCKRLSECNALFEADVDIPDQKCYQCLIDWLRRPAEE